MEAGSNTPPPLTGCGRRTPPSTVANRSGWPSTRPTSSGPVPPPRRGVSTSPGSTGVIEVDPVERTAEVQGMCTYEHLVDATLPHGLMPYVVPQLRTITLGGAVSGLGIESTSFRNGFPHESVLEMDIFTGAGEVVTTRPGEDLFDTFPNSYGSLGYATRLRIALEPVPDRVRLRHVRVRRPRTARQDHRRGRRLRRVRRPAGRRARRRRVRAGGVLPDLRDLGRRGRAGGPSPRATTRARRSTTSRSSSARPTCSRRTTTCGGGTPTGSGARRRSASRTRSSGGCGRGAGAAPTSTTSWSGWTAGSRSPTGSTAAPGAPSASA